MRTYVGVTDGDWATYLSERPDLAEVNFWLQSPLMGFGALRPGEPFLFKTHYPDNRLVGGGFFEGFVRLRLSEAWEFFGEGNGVSNVGELRARRDRYRRSVQANRTSVESHLASELDPAIGCVMLRDVVWFGASSLPGPESFAKNIVRGKRFAQGQDQGVDLALELLLTGTRVVAGMDVEDNVGLGRTLGDPRLMVPRLNQGAFRAAVLDAYQSRCAVTGHRIRPTLQAAHIRPVARGGEHRVDNGLLSRSDIHTLFDQGYVTVDPSFRVRVSPRLREEFGNGDDLYALEAPRAQIQLPRGQSNQPSATALEWHGDEVFLAS